MTDEKMFMDLPQDEQQMLIEEIKKLKLTCEPKKMKASEIYALIDNAAQKVDIIQENNQEQSIISVEEQQNPDNVNQVLSETNDNEQPTVENLENNEKTVVNPEKNKQEQIVPEDKNEEIKKEESSKQIPKKMQKYDGLCISCYSKVYDGVCCGCGRRY